MEKAVAIHKHKSTSESRQQQRSDGQGLAEAFILCTQRLDCGFKRSLAQDEFGILSLSLLRLRLSRWGEACNIHKGPELAGDVEDFRDANEKLHSLLAFFDTKGHGYDEKIMNTYSPHTQSIVNTTDAIVARRSALLQPLQCPTPGPKQNGACLNWTSVQYEEAASYLSELEEILGGGRLRDLSLREKVEFEAAHDHLAIFYLSEAARFVDCWSAGHANPGGGSGGSGRDDWSSGSCSNVTLETFLGETVIQEVLPPPTR